MCAFRCALLLCGLAVSLHLVWAAPHCVRKPTTTVKPEQCVMDYREMDPYATIGNITFGIGRSHNLTCQPVNRNGMKSLVLSVAFVDVIKLDQNYGNREFQYLRDYPNNGEIWMNLHCSRDKDNMGNNIIYFKPNGTNYRVRFVRCGERRETFESAEKERVDDNYTYFVWNLEHADRSL